MWSQDVSSACYCCCCCMRRDGWSSCGLQPIPDWETGAGCENGSGEGWARGVSSLRERSSEPKVGKTQQLRRRDAEGKKKTAGIVKQRLAGGFCDDVVCRQGAVGIGTSGDLVAREGREPQLCATLPGTCSPPRHWAWAWGLHPGWLRDCVRDWEPSQDISAQTGKAGAPTVPHPLHRIHFASKWNSGPADCRLQSTSQKPLRVQFAEPKTVDLAAMLTILRPIK